MSIAINSRLAGEIAKCTHFTKLDFCNAYNFIRIKEGHEYFDTMYGKFEYIWVNQLAAFSRFMNQIFSDVLDKFIVLY